MHILIKMPACMHVAGFDLYVCRCICDFVTGNNRRRETLCHCDCSLLMMTMQETQSMEIVSYFQFRFSSFEIVIASFFTSFRLLLHSCFESKASGLINLSYQNRFSYTLSYKLLCIFYAICVFHNRKQQKKIIEKELFKLFSSFWNCHNYSYATHICIFTQKLSIFLLVCVSFVFTKFKSISICAKRNHNC